ncbi:hypothetical protein [Moheibacter sediminis]|uniref:HmuY protein n=1 Tax=Moheibacter sediminis TaxID=1434700 RepID=A0A1W1YPB9_9FLAO|nr:hypothetical protein [Moheibacter sediminis]SMC37661.1 hypothetical protein SAMN06296427_101576 [Moheibacter sediminis]
MKRKMISYLMVGVLSLTFSACSSDDEGDNGNGNPTEILLVEHNNKVVGWGKGRANTDAYLSLSVGDGQIQSFRTVDDNDIETQELVDLVFPGDWGNNDGELTITAPGSSGAGGAEWEYCTNWQRKKGTQLGELDDFDLSDFENVKNAAQLIALHEEYRSIYSYHDWLAGTEVNMGSSFLIRTYEGRLAIAYVQNVQGVYGDTQAKLTLKIKVMPDLD